MYAVWHENAFCPRSVYRDKRDAQYWAAEAPELTFEGLAQVIPVYVTPIYKK